MSTISFFSGFTSFDATVNTPLRTNRYTRLITTSFPNPIIRINTQLEEDGTLYTFDEPINFSNRIYTPFRTDIVGNNTIKIIQTEEGNDVRHIHIWIEEGTFASFLIQSIPSESTVTGQYYNSIGTVPSGQNAISYDKFMVRKRLIKEYEASKRVDVVDFGSIVDSNLVFTGISLDTLRVIQSLYTRGDFYISMSSGSLLDREQDALLTSNDEPIIDNYGREPFRLQDIYKVTCSNYYDPRLYEDLFNTGSSINLSIRSIQ